MVTEAAMSEDPGSALVERAGEAASQGRWPQAFALLTEADGGGLLASALDEARAWVLAHTAPSSTTGVTAVTVLLTHLG
jgi:hypothetical protein